MPRTAALHSHGPLPSSPACPRRAQAPPSPTRPLSYYCGRRGLQENPPLPPAHPAIRRSASGPPVYPQRWTSGDLDPSPPSDASSVASTASAPSHAPVLDPAPASAATGGPASSNPPTPGETVVSDSTVGTTPWSTPRPLAFSPMTPHASSDPPSRARSPGRSPTGRFVHSPVGSSPTPPAAAGTSPPTPVRCPPLRPVPDQEAGAEGPGSAYESDEGSDAALYLVAPVREEIDYTFTANTTATCASSVHTDAPVAVDLPVEAEQPLREGVAAGGGFHGTAGNAPPVDPSTSSAAPTLSSSCSSTSSTATSATTSSSSASSSATSSASAASSQSVSPAVVVPEPRVSPPAAHDVVSPEPLRCEVYSTAEASPEATPHGSPRGSPASTPRQRGPQPTATEAALLAALKAELAMREVDAARWERRFDAQQQSVRDLTAELAAMRGQLAAALALRCPTCDAAVGPEPKPAASAPRARARALVSPSPDKPRRRLVSPAPDRDAAVLEPRSPAPRTPTAPSPQAALPESPAKRGFTVSCSAAVSAPGTPNPLLALLSEAEREAAGHRGGTG